MWSTRVLNCRAYRGTLLAAILLLSASSSPAQDVTEPALKAAFIYNFAKFTRWPPDALSGTDPFTICVLGDPAIGNALERAVKGRSLSGHALHVLGVTLDAPLRSCHVLYVSGIATKQWVQIAALLREAPILTISEFENFARLGGVVHFFVEGGTMRFGINLESVKRSRLSLSSQLLALARLVSDGESE